MPTCPRQPSPCSSCRIDGARPAHGQRGFTLVELITVLVLMSILAFVAAPRIGEVSSVRGLAFHDEIVAALRHAQKTAVSHRRLVCATVDSAAVSLSIAPTPGAGCSSPLPGPDGNLAYASTANAGISAALSPAGSLNADGSANTANIPYFQANGSIARDAAGTTLTQWQIAVTQASAIDIYGQTGHVE